MGTYLKEIKCTCNKKILVHKKVNDAHPYGGNYEWDECPVCKEKHNFKQIKKGNYND